MNIQVYSANVGKVDPFRPEEIDLSGNYGLKIFTDNILGDNLLSARFYKCCPHLLFPEADWTIWIDANIWLNVSPRTLVEKVIEESEFYDFGVFRHTWGGNVFDEANRVIEGGFDTERRVNRTLRRWLELDYEDYPEQAMTMVLVRRNLVQTQQRNEGWWMDICYGSRRDQLSFGLHFPGPYWETVDFTKPNKYFTRVA